VLALVGVTLTTWAIKVHRKCSERYSEVYGGAGGCRIPCLLSHKSKHALKNWPVGRVRGQLVSGILHC